MKIAIATDHAGRDIKLKVIEFLMQNQMEIIDLSKVNEPTDDYPDFAFEVGKNVARNKANFGILICNTGIGVSIAANKVKGARCALVHSTKDAKLARLHNDANIVALSSSMSMFRIKDILDVFINTKFSDIERHSTRVEMINKYK